MSRKKRNKDSRPARNFKQPLLTPKSEKENAKTEPYDPTGENQENQDKSKIEKTTQADAKQPKVKAEKKSISASVVWIGGVVTTVVAIGSIGGWITELRSDVTNNTKSLDGYIKKAAEKFEKYDQLELNSFKRNLEKELKDLKEIQKKTSEKIQKMEKQLLTIELTSKLKKEKNKNQ